MLVIHILDGRFIFSLNKYLLLYVEKQQEVKVAHSEIVGVLRILMHDRGKRKQGKEQRNNARQKYHRRVGWESENGILVKGVRG